MQLTASYDSALHGRVSIVGTFEPAEPDVGILSTSWSIDEATDEDGHPIDVPDFELQAAVDALDEAWAEICLGRASEEPDYSECNLWSMTDEDCEAFAQDADLYLAAAGAR